MAWLITKITRIIMPLAKWAETLESYAADNMGEYVNSEVEIHKKMKDIFIKRRKKEMERMPSLLSLPHFYKPPISADNKLKCELQKLARTRFLQRKTLSLPEEEDLERLAYLLTEHRSLPEDKQERINYDQFVIVMRSMPERCRSFFVPATFCKFARDKYGRISTHEFFQFVCRKVNYVQARIQLSVYDYEGNGFLREPDLETYVYELMPVLEPLKSLQENFYPFYVFTAVRKFLFFLDHKKSGKVGVKDILTSPALSELLELRSDDWNDDDDANKRNWFSPTNALRVYGQYLELDHDHDGMLSSMELMRYGLGSFTHVFISRVFEECHTYDGKMDYKTFLDFVLAIENRTTESGLHYFWRLLDMEHCGYIDKGVIKYFLKEIIERMMEAGHEPVKDDDVVDEIFDMVNPKDPVRISFKDLVTCGVGDLIVQMLTDTNGFMAYDQRENNIGPDEEDG